LFIEEPLPPFGQDQIRRGTLLDREDPKGFHCQQGIGYTRETFRVYYTTFRAGLSKQKISDFFNAYAKAINQSCGWSGSLFQHPFGRVPITTGRQFWNVIAYIHQNPQKHKFVEDFRDWKWSSYGIILNEKPTKLERDTVLEWFGGRQQYMSLHSEWATEANSKWFAGDDPN
jgi:hypothetical protein